MTKIVQMIIRKSSGLIGCLARLVLKLGFMLFDMEPHTIRHSLASLRFASIDRFKGNRSATFVMASASGYPFTTRTVNCNCIHE